MKSFPVTAKILRKRFSALYRKAQVNMERKMKVIFKEIAQEADVRRLLKKEINDGCFSSI